MQLLPDRVRELRLQRNWTQQHLAEASGVSLRTIQRIEKTGNASNETVMSLCASMQINADELKAIPRTSERDWQPVSIKPQLMMLLIALITGMGCGAILMYAFMN